MFRIPASVDSSIETLFEMLPNPYVVLDRELRIVGVNRAYLSVTGRNAESLLGVKLLDAFPSDPDSPSGRQLRQSFERVLNERSVSHIARIHYPITGPDGAVEDRYWSTTHVPVLDRQGEVELILQHTVDITELVQLRESAAAAPIAVEASVMRRAEALQADYAALGAERQFLRQLFEQAPGFMAVLRGPEHVFELVNAAYLQLIGHRSVVGKAVRDALPELHGQGLFEIADQVYRSGEPFVGRAMPAELQREPDADLQKVFLDFVVQPIRDPAGTVAGLFVQGHDITEQLQAQQAASESEERFRTLAHSMPNHVWTATADGRIDWCNEQTLEYAGVELDALSGDRWVSIVNPDDVPVAEAAWRRSIARGEPYRTEFRLRRHDGVERWHLARATALRDAAGQIKRWIGTNTDIDDQKASAALLSDLNNVLARRVQERTLELQKVQDVLRHSQKMEAIGNLAGGIAHDFNNLLQVIGGNLQLLSRDVVGQPRAEDRVNKALGGVVRGAKLASQLLAFGRRQPLAPRVVNVGRLIREMDDMLRGSLGEAIEIDTVIAAGLWNTLADPVNVENALLNLTLNSRDAMGGHGRLTIEAGNAWIDDAYAMAHDDVQPGQYVMIAVTDTGSGMTPETVARAFDPFFTTKPEGKGTGLGLSMVYGFVKQSGGHINVYSEPGQGTTVKIYLPRSIGGEDPPAEPVAEQVETGNEMVLVVEDDDGVRETAVALLSELGYRVLKARDADAARAIIESGVAIDLLFTDVVMPGQLRSTELVRLARQRLPGLAVLFTSGYPENSIVHGGRLDPGVHLLGKPYTREALARKVRRVLSAAKLSDNREPAKPGTDVERLDVLLCEDDFAVRQTMAELLESMGCRVAQAGNAADARARIDAGRCDLLITDLGLPDEDGLDLAAWALDRRPGLVIAIASGMGTAHAARLPGVLTLGKPFDVDDLEKLLGEARTRLRRSASCS
ncbi:PAS domain-containing protein [Piscinibacter sakaiensis]|uniref:PAS domain-containing protein n=1 Tax=Piscinibacter sakaiensis TaxID=1547922 RepID=UPI003AAFFA5A